MRIDRLVIRGYGPLCDLARDFSAGDEGLHVVHGPNESGKSLSLKALEHGLFGVPRKIEGFSDNDMQRVDLELAVSRRKPAGGRERLEFRRLRSRAVRVDGDAPIAESDIAAFLGRATLAIFCEAYGLSSHRIREGGRLLQESKGDIAAPLFAAATGLEQVARVQKDLDTRHAKLFSPSRTATTPALNDAVLSLRRSLAEYSAALQLPEATDRLEARLAERIAAVARLDGRIAELARRQARLALVRGALAPAMELAAARRRLEELGTPPPLADSFRTRLDTARTTIARTTAIEEDRKAGLAALENRRDAVTIDEAALGAAEAIGKLVRSTDELLGCDADLPKRKAEAARLAEENDHDFAAIRVTTGSPLRPDAILSPTAHGQIQDLITAHGGLRSAFTERSRQREEAREALAALEQEFAQLPDVGDDREPAARLTAIRDSGDVEARLEARRGERTAAVEDYAVACRRLGIAATEGRPAAGGDSIEELPAPSAAEVREYRERFRGLDAEAADIAREAADANDAIAALEKRIALLEESGTLPAEGELEAARRARDEKIDALARGAAGGEPLTGIELKAALAAVRSLIARADDVADRLRAHADAATSRRQHRADILEHREQLDRSGRKAKDLAAQRSAALEEWRALWRPAGVEPGTPAAMEGWLAAHGECRQLAGVVRTCRRDEAALERLVAEERGALAAIAGALGIDVPATASRRDLLALVGRGVDERRAQGVARREKARRIEEAKAAVARQQALFDAAQQSLAAWQTSWGECMAVLDQPAATTTAAGGFLLDAMRRVAARQRQIGELGVRIGGMGTRRDEILAVMRQVCDALGLDHAPGAIAETGRAAVARLRAAEQARATRAAIDADIARRRQELADNRRERQGAEGVIAALVTEAGVKGPEELDAAWDRRERHRAVRAEVDGWRHKFLVAAGGAEPEPLLEECLATPASDVEEEARKLDEEAACLRNERDGLRDERLDLERQVQSLGGERSIRAHADCRMHEAAVLDRVAEYLPLRLAALALNRAARRYRDEHQAPVLRRAAELFARITGGAYTDIRVAEKDVYAVRAAAAGQPVFQRQMSEGTNDQVYLALRLAALEHGHEQGAEPLPLVLDDGLVHFDDDRTRAMLDVLADVSARMQVIVFTHHRSVIDSARGLAAARPGSVFVHERPAG
jgi:uncharacterized protein YhaN